MFKEEKRLFDEIKSTRRAWCCPGKDEDIICAVQIGGVTWKYTNIGERWLKSLYFYGADHNGNELTYVSLGNVSGIDILRENQTTAAYVITYGDGKQFEIYVEKPKNEKKKEE